MQQPRLQVSRAAENQILHCLSGLRANFAKFSFQKYPQRPAITRRGQSHTLTPWPVTQARLAQHVELTVTRDGHLSRTARLIRPGPSHSQQPTVHHSPQRASLAAARVTRSGPPGPQPTHWRRLRYGREQAGLGGGGEQTEGHLAVGRACCQTLGRQQ